ncbi:hypothetical protein [uncultured Marinobacter sp.]|uniref:hypothetical protein n=1 Tax=uncultured Marinobacter sp. TaxID=187379 RepID=UPI0030D8996B
MTTDTYGKEYGAALAVLDKLEAEILAEPVEEQQTEADKQIEAQYDVVLSTVTTRERRKGAMQIWLQGTALFAAAGASAGSAYDVDMKTGSAVIRFHENGRRRVHAHKSSGRPIIDMTSKSVTAFFGHCTVEVTAVDNTLVLTRKAGA